MKTLYHGTGCDRLKPILAAGPILKERSYLWKKVGSSLKQDYRPAFSTTLEFEIAALFAFRRSPSTILKGDMTNAGIILEYALAGHAEEGKDWAHAKDSGVLQDEHEIAIFNPRLLTLVAIWKFDREWARDLLVVTM